MRSGAIRASIGIPAHAKPTAAPQVATNTTVSDRGRVNLRPGLGPRASEYGWTGAPQVCRRCDQYSEGEQQNPARHHRNASAFEERLNHLGEPRVSVFEVRHGFAEGVDGDDAAPRIHMSGFDATLRKSRSRDLARDALAEAGDGIRGPGREFTHGDDAAQEFVQAIEIGFQLGCDLLESVRAQKIASAVVMAFTRGTRKIERFCMLAP